MGDYDYGLEDKILRRNIPGRFSTWEEEADDERGSEGEGPVVEHGTASEVADMEAMQRLNQNGVPETVAKTAYARSHGHRTGPKGVLEDYREHQRQQWAQHQAEAAEREAILHRIAYGASAGSSTGGGGGDGDGGAQGGKGATPGRGVAGEDESDAEDDDEALILQSLREQRLRELQAEASLPVFGELRVVAANEDFLDAVNHEDPRVFVVVHVCDESVKACRTMNGALERLARSLPHVKCLRLAAHEAPSHFDRDVLPVLIFYRGGELYDTCIRATDTLGHSFTPDDVESLLSEYNIVGGSALSASLGPQSRSKFTQGLSREDVAFDFDGEDSDGSLT